MKRETLSILCSPRTHEFLQLIIEKGEEFLLSEKSKEKFIIKDGIPIFLIKSEVKGLNRKYQRMYDIIAPFYDLPFKLYNFFTHGAEGRIRMEYLKELEIKDGAKILEVAIGTGANFRYLPKAIQIFGLDISWRMLKKCQRNFRKWGLNAELFLGEAEGLPFMDEIFDVVFHVGGINFFNDKAKAINEMIRVAKPGTKIVLVDETEKLAKTFYEKTPFLKRFYKNRKGKISPPIDLVPREMLDIRLSYLWNDRLYCLSFRKPR